MGHVQVVEQVQGAAEALVATGGQVARDVEVVVLPAYGVDASDNEPVMGLRVTISLNRYSDSSRRSWLMPSGASMMSRSGFCPGFQKPRVAATNGWARCRSDVK